MLVGKPTSDWREQVEHSLLIVAIVSFTFHFIGRLSSDAILAANIDDGIKENNLLLLLRFLRGSLCFLYILLA